MAFDPRAIRAKASRAYARAREWAQLHRFWIEAVGVTLMTLAVLGVIGGLALRRAGSWTEQARQLDAVRDELRAAVARFQAPDSAEMVRWRESGEILARIAAEPAQPLEAAGLVAARAQAVGLGSIRIRLVPDDSAVAVGDIAAGDWIAEAIPTTIVAEFASGPGAAARFLEALPPGIEVASARISPDGDGLMNEFHLVIRSLRGPS